MLASILIKFICRYLPYGAKNIDKQKSLFEMIIAKNTYLSRNKTEELLKLKNDNIDAKVYDAIDITRKLVNKNKLKKEKLIEKKEVKEKIIEENNDKDIINDNEDFLGDLENDDPFE